MASRSIEDLHPVLKPLAEEFVKRCEAAGVPVKIYMTWRSPEEQNELFKQGRTKPGRVVTYARGGKSDHNFMLDGKPASLAFDAVPLVDGKAAWKRYDLFNRMGKIAADLGILWGGSWENFKDSCHFYIKP